VIAFVFIGFNPQNDLDKTTAKSSKRLCARLCARLWAVVCMNGVWYIGCGI
jgi:hypothetical protein